MAGDTITNFATASGLDDDGNPVSDDDDAVVAINDVPSTILTTKTANPTSVTEPGGNADYTVTVKNTSAPDTVTINSVVDDVFGDVSPSCSPALPADLLPGEIVTCTFTELVSGMPGDTHTNISLASGIDDDGNSVSDADDADVTFDDVDPAISVDKTADRTLVVAPGEDVTFTVTVTNDSVPTDPVTIDSLTDSIHVT
jgi:uncharacterized repeat protein (TIGR01451 family)